MKREAELPFLSPPFLWFPSHGSCLETCFVRLESLARNLLVRTGYRVESSLGTEQVEHDLTVSTIYI